MIPMEQTPLEQTSLEQAVTQNAFVGWKHQPQDADVRKALGVSAAAWNQLLEDLEQAFGLTTKEWTSYSPKAGWSLRLKKGKRNILYLSPFEGSFQASVILGGKAIEAAKASGPRQEMLDLLAGGQRYPEGTAIRVDVQESKELAVVLRLTEWKLAS